MLILKEVVRQRRISQNRLSQLARIPASNLSLIINGKLTPCPAWRKRISDVLDVPESFLFPESEVTPDGHAKNENHN